MILVPVYHPFLGEGARNSQENERSHSIAMRKARIFVSLVPRLSPHANEKSKERGEPGRIYHVRNVIGRENLITCGRTNELPHAVRTEYSCDSFMADRMGLDGTVLHYLAVRKATVSVHKPYIRKSR